ncbi:methionine ABC transporter ATP-binding protein [Marinococcus halophilus]|uniref:Methionine import ATP-binding protein MetN n=1 Tax=Marinococcus halophilus TaxID=1371 RepID=A0A510Y7Z2_MARHA|nr:methionine ABC transporter ATP-binding protein [Marinococcus halophilus]OZT79405.1 methionine ABC transporter ATP-binding protein [Marinococcus halophilus]GEK59485.1 methionine import ATP-binding protein MetN [Marinococcus halophilus]
MIQLKGLSKAFQTKTQTVTAVDNVSLSIDEGEIFGIIGYSGAGKSTLVRLLNKLETATSGEVTIEGESITSLKGQSLRSARQEIGMVFQHFNLLWSRTVAENIAFPLEIAKQSKQERNKRVQELVNLVGLEGREDSYPSQLSGGQKQRVGIARALANNPKVLLCDEATSALDPKTTDSILALLTDINKKLGLTIVLITHEMHVIRKICHRVAVMENGRVVEEGPVLQVFRKPQEHMTKEFVRQITEPEEDASEIVFNEEETGAVVQLKFLENKAEQPFISKVIRQFDVDVNIIQGKISQTQRGSYGSLFIRIKGSHEEIEKALDYLREEEIEAEVMEHA